MTNGLVLQAPAPPEGHINNLLPLYTQNAAQQPARKAFRSLPQAPERILDAPELLDDYYLNLLDWSSQNVVSSWILSCVPVPMPARSAYFCCSEILITQSTTTFIRYLTLQEKVCVHKPTV
jgi:hypothetical protein